MKAIKNVKSLMSILTICVSICLMSCNNDIEKRKAENTVLKFYSALREENEEKMKEVYDGITNFNSYYKSDTVIIKEIKIIKNCNFEIKTINQFTNGYGKKFNHEIIFYLCYLKFDSINDANYIIYDSKGLCGYNDDETYNFALKTGCISKNDTTDQQIIEKLTIADKMILNKKNEIYFELWGNVSVVNWNWESGYGGSANGKGIVKNASTFNLPNLKYKISYYDYNNNLITTDDGIVTYDTFYAGESKSFTFYTSYVGDASKADIILIFDKETIMNYVINNNYTGKEYQEYIAIKDSTNKN